MCLVATTGIKTAKRDITVYKILTRDMKSPIFGGAEKWKFGETVTVPHFTKGDAPRKFKGVKRGDIINKGLHACRKPEQLYLTGHIFVGTIPKGTPYILGTGGEIVALTMRIERRFNG